MRQLMLTAILLLLGSLAGCAGRDCGGCSTGGCSTGGCAGGGCARGGVWSHTHGVCDCEMDDHCTSRSPWIRNVAAVEPASEPVKPPAKLPDGKKKELEE